MSKVKEHRGTVILGTVLILVGLVFMIRRLDLLPSTVEHYVFSWPSLLILIGGAQLFQARKRFGGVVLILVGSFFMAESILDNIYRFEIWTWEYLLPTVLIVAGVLFVVRPFLTESKDAHGYDQSYPQEG